MSQPGTSIVIDNKSFNGKVVRVKDPEFVFVVHHGMISNHTSFRYFEQWLDGKAALVLYDARGNGETKLSSSRRWKTYAEDLRSVVKYAQQEWPMAKIVVVGSSWGAAVVFDYLVKYPNEVYRAVTWSVPFDIFGNADKHRKSAPKKIVKEGEAQKVTADKNLPRETTKMGYVWKFFLMLTLNISTKSYTKIDLNRIADNATFRRLNDLARPEKTEIKMFWAAFRSIRHSLKKLEVIANRPGPAKLIYLQTIKDSYLRSGDLDKLQKLTGEGALIKILTGGTHAFQWDTTDNYHHYVFALVWEWLTS